MTENDNLLSSDLDISTEPVRISPEKASSLISAIADSLQKESENLEELGLCADSLKKLASSLRSISDSL